MENTLENEMLDAAISWCDSNGINVLEPEQLSSLVNSLYVTVCDAALDTAQPVPEVNAMLVEALEKCKVALEWAIEQGGGPVCEHEGAVCFCKENTALNFANAALTAAQQAQPVCGYDDETGNCTRVNCCKQAQPERAPLSEAQVTVLLDSYYASDFGPDELIRKVEQLHGIKQGGQHD